MSRWDFRPHGSTVVDEEAFACVTELETRHAARLRYTVSMLTVYPIPAMPVVNPADAAEQLAAAVSPLIRDTDLVEIVPSAAAVRVLLVGGELKDLRTVIQRIIAEVSLHRSDGQQALLVRIGGSCFPTTAGSSRELLQQADALAEEARRERGVQSTYRLPVRREA